MTHADTRTVEAADDATARIAAARHARRRLVLAHQNLVAATARRYDGLGVPLNDLIQEGNVGLLRATQRFDPSRAGTFAAYAAWWIRESMERAVASAAAGARGSQEATTDLAAVRRVRRDLRGSLGREPRAREIAKETGLAVERVAELLGGRPIVSPIRLSPLVALGDPGLAEVVTDDGADVPLEVVLRGARRRRVRDALNEVLTVRGARVLALRFGLEDGDTYSLQEVAEKLCLSRERIRQIERDALWRLRSVLAAGD